MYVIYIWQVSSFAQILLERHDVIFALGYVTFQRLDVAVAFVQLLLELGLELVVDNVVSWAECEHGIPMTQYFTRVRYSSERYRPHDCVCSFVVLVSMLLIVRIHV